MTVADSRDCAKPTSSLHRPMTSITLSSTLTSDGSQSSVPHLSIAPSSLSHRHEKDSISRHVEEVQRLMENVSIDMWASRIRTIKGGEVLWYVLNRSWSTIDGSSGLNRSQAKRRVQAQAIFADSLILPPRQKGMSILQTQLRIE